VELACSLEDVRNLNLFAYDISDASVLSDLPNVEVCQCGSVKRFLFHVGGIGIIGEYGTNNACL